MAKAPSGLSLKRNGNSFSCGWKKGDKYTAQQFQYRIGGGKWTALSVAKGTTSKAFSININNYYPVKSGTIGSVSFRVRGKKGKWSGWSNKSFAITAPRPASVDVSRSDDYTNVATFSWSVVVNSNDAPMFTNCEWQTIRADDASVTNGAQLKWNSSVAGWQTGTASPTSYSKEITEETDVLANGSHTRWFRVRSRGVRGASEWRYSKWVYAIPYAAVIESATATVSDAGGFICTVKWTADATAANPIAAVHVQYSIVTPDIGMTYPDSDSWTDAMTIRDTSGADAATFSISGSPTADQCLFVRVNTEHDGKLTYGIPKVAAVGRLADPENLSVDTYPDTHRATITATNTSNVPDSFLAVIYRVASEPDKSFVVGIIPHGETSVNVQCPDWGSESPAFGVYAVAGSYKEQAREDGVSNYAVDATMTSIETLWRGGQVPLAPTNVVVTPTETTGTVRVTWDWNWREAEEAILSWSDHADAWESTDEPTEFRISNLHASQWNIAELETGKKWYVKVRLVKLSGDGETPSPWSEIASIDLSSAPSIPSLTLSSSIITTDGSLTAYWSYITTDGTKQAYAEICEATIGSEGIEYGDIVAHTETAQHITINAEDIGWSAGETHYLAVRVVSGAGKRSDGWSVPVPVTIAEPLEATITQTSLVTENAEVNPRTFSGEMVTFNTEMAETVADLEVTINPIQDLNGYDHPWVGGAGKNKLYIAPQTLTSNGITWTVNADGTITATGTLTATNSAVYINVTVPTGSYKFNGSGTGSSNTTYYAQIVDGSTWYDPDYGNNDKDVTISSSNVRLYANTRVSPPSGGITFKPMLRASGTSADFEPYSNICPISGWDSVEVVVSPTTSAEDGTTRTATFDETVYGGTVDLVSGVLTVDRAVVDLGTLNWSIYNGKFTSTLNPEPLRETYGAINMLCSIYKTGVYGGSGSQGDGTVWLSVSTSSQTLYVEDSHFVSASEFKTAMNGVQLVYELAEPRTIQLDPQTINALVGANNVWGDGDIKIRIAEASRQALCLTEMPLTVTVKGAGEGITRLAIERAAEYHVDRPDETEYTGHDGETIVNYRQTGESQITIDTDDLIGNLDDDAQYRIVATVQDGLGQSATATKNFEVHWEHQAIMPEATVEIQNNVAIITPIKPDGWEAGDTCDIYRLSADAPELIVQGAEFGTQYVDPYPAIGEFGGHRIVYKTANGDYITAENEMAWIDLSEDDGDILDIEESIIDYGDEQIMLYYDVDVSNNWEKDFNETRYLGGSVAGDWNAGVGRSSSVSVTTLSITDKDKIKALRRLAEYPNICHIRTLDGSSYSCDIQVSENRDASKYNEVANFSLSVTRIDPQELDGITYELWSE